MDTSAKFGSASYQVCWVDLTRLARGATRPLGMTERKGGICPNG
jgi:hypothetical protein